MYSYQRNLVLGSLILIIAFFLPACGESPDDLTARQAEVLQGKSMTVYHSPTCTCCERYVSYLRNQGVEVEVVQVSDLGPIKRRYGLTRDTGSCHTGILGKYVVEGHVPLQAVAALERKQPDIRGITIPGMPQHAPGMGEPIGDPLTVYTIGDNGRRTGTFFRMQY